MPLGIWVNDWDSARVVAEVYSILAEEVLGYNVFKDYGSQSTLQLIKLAGCEHNRSNNANLGGCGPPRRFHVGLENWVTQEENIANIKAAYGRYAPEWIGHTGYVGVEGMYVLGEARRRALYASGLALEHYLSYNSSFHEPQKYTANVADIDLALLQRCADTLERSWQLLGTAYLDATGDVDGTEVKNGVIVMKCWEGKWWAAPRCRHNVSQCVAVVTGGAGWGMTEMPQQAFFWDMPLAFATAAQGATRESWYYYSLNKQLQSLLYWWSPDTMFALDDPSMIIFPKYNFAEYAAGLYRTSKDRAILNKCVAGGLSGSDIRQAKQLAAGLRFTDEALRALLEKYAVNRSTTSTACWWVRTHRSIWREWLPNETSCTPGYGLVDENATFVTRGAQGQAVACRPCYPGRYSEPFEATRICSPCMPGTHQPSPAESVCLPCAVGHMAGEEGQALCQPCPLGFYADSSGARTCHVCANSTEQMPLWTTSRLLVDRGEWIPTLGSTSASHCTCIDDYVFVSGECRRCKQGSLCRHGGVSLLPGHWCPESDPLRVFSCSSPERCPGGDPGTCRGGRDPDSVACFRCMPGLHEASGICKRCSTRDYAWIAASLMLCIMGVFAMYTVNIVARDVRQAGPGSLLMAALGLGQMVTVVQQLLIIQQFQIDWIEPFRSLMAALQIVAFDLHELQLGCVAPTVSFSNFLFRSLILPTFCLVAGAIHMAYTYLRCAASWRHRRIRPGAGPKPEMTLLWSTVGTLWLVFFISHGATILAPFRCAEHPSGEQTVQGYEDVICNYTGEHLRMVIVGSLNCLLPIGFLAACVWVICAELPKRIMIADMKFVRACSFLLLRFRPGRGILTALYLFRNALVLLCPLLPTAAWKVLSMNLLLYASLLITASGKPWRNMACNLLDIVLVAGMLVLLDMGSLSIQDPQPHTITTIATVAFSLMMGAGLAASAYGIIRYILFKLKKPFKFFLCHHKVATGSYARLLKMELDKYGYKTFIDCDNLQDLTRLFGHVGQDTEMMVVFGSRDVFTRKWCLGEIITAMLHEVPTVLLRFPFYEPPDEGFISSLPKTFPEVMDLVSYRMGLKEIEDTLHWLSSVATITIDRQVNPRAIFKVVSQLTEQQLAPLVSKPIAQPDCLILADLDSMEAAAAAYVLHGFMVPLALKRNSALMPAVHVGRHLPSETKAIFLVCSDGCFENPMVASWLWQLRSLEECAVVPVVVEAGFRFPSHSFYEDISQCPQLHLLGVDLHEYAQIGRVLFGELWSFVTFLPQSSSTPELELRADQAQKLLGTAPPFAHRLRAAKATEEQSESSEQVVTSAPSLPLSATPTLAPQKMEDSVDLQFMAEIYQMYFCPMTQEAF